MRHCAPELGRGLPEIFLKLAKKSGIAAPFREHVARPDLTRAEKDFANNRKRPHHVVIRIYPWH
jgi:hypothetical protein